ncbi:uncharacterized protein THITE_2106121 [Thermothielavioides terrestris NRRL 8126]|uniref:Uncharacterized protein n=1 Tax=Thermothielavioides terrestris (strain ATCC 38088 / NRRL 8126) TaxID=578455 RepID=G2QW35_THETT|nr:uncharacterized protein THITE_2106121 [Thermothielavioides terrestris NRRL 8126]AEO62206.1 hypothetical protein THITE_2106121 [Thermothielavioides terrestris NRRL 8126]
MARRNILLCFDAFGTLFKPKRPIQEQYASVARQCGLDGFSAEQVQASFKAAFSGESKAHPNYGKDSGMGAEKWWTNVIHQTFRPLIGPDKKLPEDLAPRLLHRFSSDEGYAPAPGVVSLLRSLKQQQQQQGRNRITVGVITNSDDRVPSILSSLGLRVSPLRYGYGASTDLDLARASGHAYDIDLHCMSYDVGFAKPDRRIFDAAEHMANQLLAMQQQRGAETGSSGSAKGDSPWLKLYVGDDFEKDVVGAQGAGWNAVFVSPEEHSVSDQKKDMSDLEQLEGKTLEDVFPQDGPSPTLIRAERTQSFLAWLMKRCAEGDQ